MGRKPVNTRVRFWRDADIPGLEVRYSSYNEKAFRPHFHESCSLGLILTGRTRFLFEGVCHDARAGQIALIPPGVVHACNPDPGMTYFMFHMEVPLLLDMTEEIGMPSHVLPAFPRPVVDDPELFQSWLGLQRAMGEGSSRLEKQFLLVHCVSELLIRHTSMRTVEREVSAPGAVERVKQILGERLDEKVTLEELAGCVGVSRYHLLRLFRDRTGLPPHAFQNQLRVDMAKRLLVKGMSPSGVAQEVGFSDQGHFSRVFKQFTGATPRQYQGVGC